MLGERASALQFSVIAHTAFVVCVSAVAFVKGPPSNQAVRCRSCGSQPEKKAQPQYPGGIALNTCDSPADSHDPFHIVFLYSRTALDYAGPEVLNLSMTSHRPLLLPAIYNASQDLVDLAARIIFRYFF
jgi:hypothetical protein